MSVINDVLGNLRTRDPYGLTRNTEHFWQDLAIHPVWPSQRMRTSPFIRQLGVWVILAGTVCGLAIGQWPRWFAVAPVIAYQYATLPDTPRLVWHTPWVSVEWGRLRDTGPSIVPLKGYYAPPWAWAPATHSLRQYAVPLTAEQIVQKMADWNARYHFASATDEAQPLMVQQDAMEQVALPPVWDTDPTSCEQAIVRAIRMQDGQQVVKGLEIAANRYPDKPYVYRWQRLRAQWLQTQGKFTEAIAHLSRDMPAVADDPAYHVLLAQLLQREGNYTRAEAVYLDLLSVDTEQAAWWAGLGMAREGQQRPWEAWQAYQQARQLASLTPALSQYVWERLLALENTTRAAPSWQTETG